MNQKLLGAYNLPPVIQLSRQKLTLKPFNLVPIEQAVIEKSFINENIIEFYIKLSSAKTAIFVERWGHQI